MRDIDGDERDAGFGDLIGDDRRDVLVDLELDDDVHALADEGLSVLDGDLRVVVVVEHHEVDPDGRRRAAQTGGHGLRERHLRRLPAEAEAQLARPRDVAVLAVGALADIAAMHERLEDAVHRGLGDLGALVDGLKHQSAGSPSAAARGCRAALVSTGIRYRRRALVLAGIHSLRECFSNGFSRRQRRSANKNLVLGGFQA